MTNFLEMNISPTSRPAVVDNIELVEISMPGREEISKKIAFNVVDHVGHEYKISDAWTYNKRKGLVPRGLWFNTYPKESGGSDIASESALAHVMKFYNVSSLKELIGKEITLFPDQEDFLLIVACNIEELEN